MLCWSALALQNLSTRFSRVKERVRKAEQKESAPRSRGKACCYLSSGTEEEMRASSGRIRDQRMRPALEGLKATGRNRRASSHRSPLSFVPFEKLFPGRNDIPVYKHPTVEPSYEQRCPGSDPHWKIPVAQWPTVLHRIDQGEPLRKVAGDYSVSYETVRRVLHAARRH